MTLRHFAATRLHGEARHQVKNESWQDSPSILKRSDMRHPPVPYRKQIVVRVGQS